VFFVTCQFNNYQEYRMMHVHEILKDNQKDGDHNLPFDVMNVLPSNS